MAVREISTGLKAFGRNTTAFTTRILVYVCFANMLNLFSIIAQARCASKDEMPLLVTGEQAGHQRSRPFPWRLEFSNHAKTKHQTKMRLVKCITILMTI